MIPSSVPPTGSVARKREAMSDGSSRRFVLGVTGNIACGKSTVMEMLGKRGAALIDADTVYHELIAPGLPLWRAIRERFGQDVTTDEGRIDRRVLGRIVFADAAALADLDRITHPAVTAELRRRVAASGEAVVAVDAVKLVEGGFGDDCDQLWLVTCQPERQIERLMSRNGLAREEAARRVAAQPPLAPKLSRADVILDNSSDLAAISAQVDAAWRSLPAAVRG